MKFMQADDDSDKPKECFICSGTGKVIIGLSEQSLEFHYDDCSQCAGTGRTD
jgi:DnaJ-class molecular chaperone